MKVFRKIKRFIVDPCLEEKETYVLRSRKLIVIAVAFISSNALLLGVPVTVISILDDPSFIGWYLVGAAVMILALVSAVIPYTYLRLTKKLPDWIVDLQIWATVPLTLTFSLYIHQGAVAISCTCAILVAVVTRIRGWPVMLIYGLAINVLHTLISGFEDELPTLHETFYNKQVLSVRIMHLFGANMCPLFFFALGLYAIMVEFAERANQADAAIAMNLAVADKLRRYDTEGVAVILAANKGKVDENLLEAFTAIQHNLQEYRPHIPDYVIAATTTTTVTEAGSGSGDNDDIGRYDDDDEGGFGVDDDSLSCGGSSSLSLCQVSKTVSMGADSNKATHDRFKPMGLISDDDLSNPRSGSSSNNNNDAGISGLHKPSKKVSNFKKKKKKNGKSRHHITYQHHHLSDNQAHQIISPAELMGGSGDNKDVRHPSIDDNTIVSPGPSILTTTTTTTDVPPLKVGPLPIFDPHPLNNYHNKRDGITLINTDVAAGRNNKYFYGKVTTVFVRFISDICGSSGGGGSGTVPRSNTRAAMKALSRCVEAASKHAKAHHGALQYMQGCGLMVSFNAASRVATHESKACAFALALYEEIDSVQYSPTSSIAMHATIVTSSNVLSYFAGNGEHLMLTVLGGFMSQHTAMHQYLSETIGTEASCVLINDSVVPTIEMFFTSRRLGSISMTAKHSSRKDRIIVSQLLAQREDQSAADEWMYATITSAEYGEEAAAIDASNRLVDQAILGGWQQVSSGGGVGGGTQKGGGEEEGNSIVNTTLFAYVSSLATSDNDVVLYRCVIQRIMDTHNNNNKTNTKGVVVDDPLSTSNNDAIGVVPPSSTGKGGAIFGVSTTPTVMW